MRSAATSHVPRGPPRLPAARMATRRPDAPARCRRRRSAASAASSACRRGRPLPQAYRRSAAPSPLPRRRPPPGLRSAARRLRPGLVTSAVRTPHTRYRLRALTARALPAPRALRALAGPGPRPILARAHGAILENLLQNCQQLTRTRPMACPRTRPPPPPTAALMSYPGTPDLYLAAAVPLSHAPGSSHRCPAPARLSPRAARATAPPARAARRSPRRCPPCSSPALLGCARPPHRPAGTPGTVPPERPVAITTWL